MYPDRIEDRTVNTFLDVTGTVLLTMGGNTPQGYPSIVLRGIPSVQFANRGLVLGNDR